MSISEHGLYPAEHRALRELYGATRQVADHWASLAPRLGGAEQARLAAGAAAARELLDELDERTAAYGVHGFPAAHGVGASLAGLRNRAGDLLLERNQALRVALLDLDHVITLLAYLAALAHRRSDAALAALHRRWETRLREHRDAAVAAVLAQAEEPERAVQPADGSPLGRAGHALATAVGTVGEAVDASRVGRAARRLRRPS